MKRNIITDLNEFILLESQKGKTFKSVIKSKEAFDILDKSKAKDTTFQFGGCWILADALSIYYNQPIFVIFNDKLNRVEHFVVQINTSYIDSDGIQSNQELINKVAKDGSYNKNDLSLIPYNPKMNTTNIPTDIATSNKLVELFKRNKI